MFLECAEPSNVFFGGRYSQFARRLRSALIRVPSDRVGQVFVPNVVVAGVVRGVQYAIAFGFPPLIIACCLFRRFCKTRTKVFV